MEEAGFQGGGDGEDEEDGDGGRCGEGVLGSGGRAVGEVERGGERDEFSVVGDVFGDALVVAAWIGIVSVCACNMLGREEDSPAMTRRACFLVCSFNPENALIASPISFFRSKRLMLRKTFFAGHIGSLLPVYDSSTSTQGYTTPGFLYFKPGNAFAKMPLVNLLLTTIASLAPVVQLSSQSKGTRYRLFSKPPFWARSLSGKWQ
jgi:hypothetical protein